MIVVLDTNIWLKELALNSSLGAAVRFFLRQRGARLAVPEVVRLEVEHNFQEKLREFVETVRSNHRQLLAVFGTLKEVVLPDEAAMQTKVTEIFSSVGVELLEVAFSFESAESSFLKTIKKLPPSDQDQQFKDGVLWADCIHLLQQDEVILVTSDAAFFHKRKYENGLAENLLLESNGQPNVLKVFRSLKELLVDIKTDINIDENLLIQAFLERHHEIVNNILNRNNFRLEEPLEIKKALYATVDPRLLHVDFGLDIACTDLSDQNRTGAILHSKGNGSYNIDNCEYSNMRITELEINFLLPDGTKEQSVNVILGGANIVIGHRDIVHNVRYNLTNGVH